MALYQLTNDRVINGIYCSGTPVNPVVVDLPPGTPTDSNLSLYVPDVAQPTVNDPLGGGQPPDSNFTI